MQTWEPGTTFAAFFGAVVSAVVVAGRATHVHPSSHGLVYIERSVNSRQYVLLLHVPCPRYKALKLIQNSSCLSAHYIKYLRTRAHTHLVQQFSAVLTGIKSLPRATSKASSSSPLPHPSSALALQHRHTPQAVTGAHRVDRSSRPSVAASLHLWPV